VSTETILLSSFSTLLAVSVALASLWQQHRKTGRDERREDTETLLDLLDEIDEMVAVPRTIDLEALARSSRRLRRAEDDSPEAIHLPLARASERLASYRYLLASRIPAGTREVQTTARLLNEAEEVRTATRKARQVIKTYRRKG
jgi:hypothetical protein